MDEMTTKLTARANELRNLIEQIGDVDAKRDAGVVGVAGYVELKGRKQAYIKALSIVDGGTYVTDEELADLVEEMCSQAAEPTQEEINTADIAFLMMIEGVE